MQTKALASEADGRRFKPCCPLLNFVHPLTGLCTMLVDLFTSALSGAQRAVSCLMHTLLK